MSLSIKQSVPTVMAAYDPAYYSVLSTKYNQGNFRYKYTITTDEGVIYTGNGYPIGSAGHTIMSPNELLKSFGDFHFQPAIAYWTSVENSLKKYRVTFYESGISGPSSLQGNLQYAFRAWDQGFYSKLLANSTIYESFLTKFGNYSGYGSFTSNKFVQKVYRDDYHTIRILNGRYRYADYLDRPEIIFSLFPKKLRINAYSKDVKNHIYVFEETVSQTTLNDSYDGYNVLPGQVIDLPVGPSNLFMKGFNVNYIGEYSPDGTWTPATTPVLSIFDPSQFEAYDIYLINSSAQRMSPTYRFELSDRPCRSIPVRLAWMNAYGGVDYFNFDKPSEKSIEVNKNTYEKNNFKLNSDGTYTSSTLRGGTTVLDTTVTTTWNIKTGFLSKAEVDGLEDLWISPHVYAQINGTWYAVINTVKKQTIHSKQVPGQVRYSFDIELANKIKF